MEQPNDLSTEGKQKTPIRHAQFLQDTNSYSQFCYFTKAERSGVFPAFPQSCLKAKRITFSLPSRKGIRCARGYAKVQRQDVNCQENYFILSNQLHLVSKRKAEQEKTPCNFVFAVQRKILYQESRKEEKDKALPQKSLWEEQKNCVYQTICLP